MNDSRVSILTALILFVLLGVDPVRANTTSDAKHWYYAVDHKAKELKLPVDVFKCGDHDSSANTIEIPSDISRLDVSVCMKHKCACGDASQKVTIELFWDLRTVDRKARYINARNWKDSLELVFGSLKNTVTAADAWKNNTRLEVIRSGDGFSSTNWGAGMPDPTYQLRRHAATTEALPSSLWVSFAHMAAPESADYYSVDGNPIPRGSLVLLFDRWRFSESDLTIPITIDTKTETSNTVSVVVQAPLRDALQSMSVGALDLKNKKIESLEYAGRDSIQIRFKNRVADDFDSAREFSLDEDRVVGLNGSGKSTLKLVPQRVACAYDVMQLSPLYEGLRQGRLYLQFKSTGNADTCIDNEYLSRFRVQGKGRVKLEEKMNHPAGAGTGVMEVAVVAVLTGDATDKTGLMLLNPMGMKVQSSTGSDGMFELTVDKLANPPTIAAHIDYGRMIPEGDSKEAWTLDEEQTSPKERGESLAAGRLNWVYPRALELGSWRVRSMSLHVDICENSSKTPKAAKKDFRTMAPGGVCVHALYETPEPLLLEFEYRPRCEEVNVDASKLPSLSNSNKGICQVSLGYLSVTTSFKTSRLDRALNLEERAQILCEHVNQGIVESLVTSAFPELRPKRVVVTSFSGTRALPAKDINECNVLVSLAKDATPGSRNGKDAQLAQETASEQLKSWGEQLLEVKARLPARNEKEKTSELFTKVVRIKHDNLKPAELQGDQFVIPIRLKLEEGIQLDDYALIEVEVSHSRSKAYVSGGESFPDSRFKGRLRLMPKWLAGRISSGVGPRGFFTVQVPTGLIRMQNSGRTATTSSAYRLVETAVFGVGGMFILEVYDFDKAAPPIPLNPQLHVGLMASATPQSGLEPPRLSAVLGTGLRLLGGEKKDGTDSGFSTVIWVEWAERARVKKWQPALLVGFSVNVGSFPN